LVLTLIFGEAGPGPTLKLEPVVGIRMEHELMCAIDGPVLARHCGHHWEVGGRKFFRVDGDKPVLVYFEDAQGQRSQDFGPFIHFSCADGIAYGDGTEIAHVDPSSREWYCHLDTKRWAEMVVLPR
jgi:hypothetical protein